MKQVNTKINEPTLITDNEGNVSLLIPYKVKRRSDRRIIQDSQGADIADTTDKQPITPLQKAMARGFRWQAMLFSGQFDSIKDLAESQGADPSYVSRMVNMTSLAPNIIEAILDETLPDGISLEKLTVGIPMVWEEQYKKLKLS